MSNENGKFEPIYNICIERLNNSPDILYFTLAHVFNLMISHGSSSHQSNSSKTFSLIKNKSKSSYDSFSYRAISFSSIMFKLFESILSHKLDDEIVSNDYQCENKAN